MIKAIWEHDPAGYEPAFPIKTHAPLLIVYNDANQDHQFTPPQSNHTLIDSLFGLSYCVEKENRALRWIHNYSEVLLSFRDRQLERIFGAQPEPGLPFIYSRDFSNVFDDYPRELSQPDYIIRTDSPELSPIPLLKVDPWCHAEAKLSRCGALTRAEVRAWSNRRPNAHAAWHAPSLPEAIRDEAHLDADYPSVDRFAPETDARVWPDREHLECYLLEESIAVAIHAYYYEVEEGPCACVAEARRVAVAAPVEDLPPWWPCASLISPEEGSRSPGSIAYEAGLQLPP